MPTRSLRYASEFGDSGYSVAARRCMGAILRTGVELAWEPLVDVPVRGRVRTADAGSAPAWLRARRSLPRNGENLVVHCVPRSWNEVIRDLSPGHVIGHSVWECEQLPSVWREQMKSADQFWVPTRWNQQVFAEAFGRPVHVVPHVVTTEHPAAVPLEIRDDVFVFASVSAWDWRKRPDRAVEAYLNAFTQNDDVVLVLKTTPNIVGWDVNVGTPVEQVTRIAARYPNPATIIVDTMPWSDAQVLGLLARADCFLSLTASEGWGLGAFDAACHGTPVLITGWGGQVEWLGSDYPGLIPYSLVPNDHPDREVFGDGMRWAYPDMSVAVEMMRDLVAGAMGNLVERARTLGPRLCEDYSVASVGRAIDEALSALPEPTVARRTARSSATDADRAARDSVLILTPVKNAARHARGYVDRVLALERPPGGLSVAILVSDSDDSSSAVFEAEFVRLRRGGIEARVLVKDFGYVIPPGVERWEPSIQIERRRVLALSRNHLLFGALGKQDWVLWLDVDVIEYPANLLSVLLDADADIVQPDCVREPGGPSFDLNAWTDRGRWHLHDYRGFERVDLHAVGGTVLLVRADCHRDGLVWPAFLYGNDHPRKRLTAEQTGRPEVGEIETEGLAMMAHDMGIACIGLPDLQVRHE